MTKTELRRALLKAKKQEHPATAAKPPKRSPTQRVAEKLVADWLRKSGLDTRALSAVQKQRRLEIDRAMKEQGSATTERRGDAVHAGGRAQAKALANLAKKGGFFSAPSVSLVQPELILAEPDGSVLSNLQIAPFASSAKIRVDTTHNRLDKLSFVFQWINNSSSAAVIDLVTSLSVHGRLDASQEGAIVFVNATEVFLTAQIELRSFALGEPTVHGVFDTTRLASLSVIGGLFNQDEHNRLTVSEGLQLTAENFPVSPRATVVIEVSFSIRCDFTGGGGHAIADFARNRRRVECPVVVVVVRRPVPVITPG